MSAVSWNLPFVINLGNSIIGVVILAIPFCFQQCGIILGSLALLFCTWLTLISCQLLIKAGVASRRGSYSFLAYYTHGATGKFIVELSMIGLQIGTLVAQVVIIGDIGPAIVSKWTGLENNATLRTGLIVFLCLFVGLPLGLLKNLRSLSSASTMCILFYTVFVIYVVSLSLRKLWEGKWYNKVYLWRPEGLLQCLPIFSFAFGCQTQLFIVYDALPEPSVKHMNSIVKSAVNMCAVAYLLVGFFGYVALCDIEISGDIITHFPLTIFSDGLKLCFVISIAVTFPLIIFPCRSSLYTLFFPHDKHKQKDDVIEGWNIPEVHFKVITAIIVLGSMTIGISVPNVEFVLAMNGATTGTLMCFVFPALFYLRVMSSSSDTKNSNVAKLVAIFGLTILLLSTFANVTSQRKTQNSELIDQEKSIADSLQVLPKADEALKPTIKENKENKKDLEEDKADHRHEPPNPKEPENNKFAIDKTEDADSAGAKVKQDTDDTEKKKMSKIENGAADDGKKENKSQKDGELKDELQKKEKELIEKEKQLDEKMKLENEKFKEKEKETEEKQQELIKQLEQQQAEQKKLLVEQKQILEELKIHKEEQHEKQEVKEGDDNRPQQGAGVQQNPPLQGDMDVPAQQLQGQQNVPAQQDHGQQNVPAQQVGQQNVPAQQVGQQNVPAQQVGQQNVPAQQVGQQNVPVQQVGQQNVPAQQVGQQNVPAQQVGQQNVPAQQVGQQNVPAQQVGQQNVPAQQVGQQNVPAQQVGQQNVPAQQVGQQNVPTQVQGQYNVPAQQMQGQQNVPAQQIIGGEQKNFPNEGIMVDQRGVFSGQEKKQVVNQQNLPQKQVMDYNLQIPKDVLQQGNQQQGDMKNNLWDIQQQAVQLVKDFVNQPVEIQQQPLQAVVNDVQRQKGFQAHDDDPLKVDSLHPVVKHDSAKQESEQNIGMPQPVKQSDNDQPVDNSRQKRDSRQRDYENNKMKQEQSANEVHNQGIDNLLNHIMNSRNEDGVHQSV